MKYINFIKIQSPHKYEGQEYAKTHLCIASLKRNRITKKVLHANSTQHSVRAAAVAECNSPIHINTNTSTAVAHSSKIPDAKKKTKTK